MTAGRLYFEFVDKAVRGELDLFWDNAPVTCGTLWEAFATPVRVTAFHAMFAGPEIMSGLPPEAQSFDPTALPVENQTITPAKGDALWYYQGRNVMKGLTDELWEIGMFYDDGGRTLGPLGFTPVTIFATMTGNLDAFAEECRDIRMSGAKTLEIGRIG